MAGAALKLTQGEELNFLKQYKKDVEKLQELQGAYEKVINDTHFKTTTGNIDDYVKEYADKNNAMLNAHEAVQNHIETMQSAYEKYGIPKQAAFGHVNDQTAFLKNLEEVKTQAVSAIKTATDATVSPDEKRDLINIADSTNTHNRKMTTAFEDKNNKKTIDSLSYFYQMMWQTTYARDRRYAERAHRLSLEGEGRQSAYDINARTGYNFQYREFTNREKIGIEGEAGYFASMRTQAGIFSLVRLGGMDNLGRFSVTRTEYKDENGQQLTDLNGNPVRGPAHTLVIQEISLHGGFGMAWKIIHRSNDEARVMQAGYSLGSLLSSHVNNTAILLDVDAIKNDKTITEARRESLLTAQADAEAQAKDFMENGITIDELAPGYGGMDFFYQMQTIANTMGIPFNKNGPTLESMLQKQIDANYHKPHLRWAAKLCIEQVRTRGVSMQKAAYTNLVKSTMKTAEYKSLRDYAILRKLISEFETYSSAPDGSKEKNTYLAYQAFNKKFEKAHPEFFDIHKGITDPEAYAKAYTKALEKEFGQEYKAAKAEIENQASPGFKELIKNACGARFTGREDWYRRLKHALKDLLTMDNKNDKGDPAVTATNEGDTNKHALDLRKGDEKALNISSAPDETLKAIEIASHKGGSTSEQNHDRDLQKITETAGLGITGKTHNVAKEEVDIVAAVKHSDKKSDNKDNNNSKLTIKNPDSPKLR